MEAAQLIKDNIQRTQDVERLEKKLMEKDREIARINKLLDSNNELIKHFNRRIRDMYEKKKRAAYRLRQFCEYAIGVAIALVIFGAGYTLLYIIIQCVIYPITGLGLQ